MTAFVGSRTEANLRQAFTTATLTHRRYSAIADQADAEGRYAVATLFRAIAGSRANQAEAHLTRLEPRNDHTHTAYNVRLAIMDELEASADAFPAMTRTAVRKAFTR